MDARADVAGRQFSIPETFAQLRSDLTNDNFLSALGRFAVDDPGRLDRLALANLRENKRARNSLSSLHAARTCVFGARQLGDRKWYADKPGIAARLKTQAQRRQFRMGLVANLAFYNTLNINDFRAMLQAGDPSGLAFLSASSQLTIPALRSIAVLAPPLDILRVISPEKAAALTATLGQISALADYVQSLCGHLAANEALEPAHAVICRLLRTGADFERAAVTNPIHLATAAVAPLCHTPDVDGVLGKSSTPKTPTARRSPSGGAPYPRGYCFAFQRGNCARVLCSFRHACTNYRVPGHGRDACPSRS